MTALITDRELEERLIAERRASGGDIWDEVWNGVYVMNPLANMEHQRLATRLVNAIANALSEVVAAEVIGPINVSDRDEGWTHNYRIPDAVVLLPGCAAKDCETHLCGGPDFVTEIVSEGDRTYQKFDFYAGIGVRELLIIDRDPWQLELYAKRTDEFELVARSTVADPQSAASTLLPLSFRLVAVAKSGRPQVEVVRTTDGQRWLA